MTEHELIEAFSAYQSLALSGASLYLSLITGYVLIAYFIGKNLTTTQLWIINVAFFVQSTPIGLGIWLYTAKTVKFAQELEKFEAQPAILSHAVIDGLLIVLGVGTLSMILVAFYFMWSTRNNTSLRSKAT